MVQAPPLLERPGHGQDSTDGGAVSLLGGARAWRASISSRWRRAGAQAATPHYVRHEGEHGTAMRMLRVAAAAAFARACSRRARRRATSARRATAIRRGSCRPARCRWAASIGEIDASSALNPASIGRLATRTILFQIEPEWRRVTSATGSNSTTTLAIRSSTSACRSGSTGSSAFRHRPCSIARGRRHVTIR